MNPSQRHNAGGRNWFLGIVASLWIFFAGSIAISLLIAFADWLINP